MSVLFTEEAHLMSFEQGWKQVYQQFPQDLESAAFYALAHTAIAHPMAGYAQRVSKFIFIAFEELQNL